jgi:hypothetical protein
MSDPASAPQATPAPMNLLARMIGVLTSPRSTFEAIVAHPRWLGALALTIAVTAALSYAFFSTSVGQNAWLDQQLQQMEAWGQQITAEQEKGMEGMMPYVKYIAPGFILLFSVVITFVVAGILYGVFNAGLGGEATFKQLLAVLTHAGAVTLLQQIVVLPLNFLRESMSSATNLGVLLPFLPEGSFLARFLGMMDIFIIWYVIVLAIGLAVLYRRRTQPIAMALFGVYLVIAVVVAAFQSMSGGGA